MKKFIIRLSIFAILMVVCDYTVGFIGFKFIENAKYGDTHRQYYIANKTNQNVLIFGSSRAIHHYDSKILEDSLGMSVYNCGFRSNGIICAYGYFRMIKERYTPKVIIYEVTPDYDLKEGDKGRFLGLLRVYYHINGGGGIF